MTERPAKSNIDSAWLASALSVLLASPHAASPDASPPLPNLGPPPDDVFSTKFDELFAPDADGFVWRHRIDRATLKDTLLGLHSRWNAVEGTCSGCDVHETQFEEFHPTMAVQIEFTPLYRYPREKGTVMALASEQEVGGVKRIECMMLEGDETLFRPELFSGGDVWSVF